MNFAEKFKGNYRSITPFSWLGIHGGAARKRRCGHHADLMHNILNSLRGEAVPEHGVMHGSAIQVSRRITSARRHVYGSTIRVLSTLVRSRQRRRYRLGRWKDLPAPSISDYRHGTASPPQKNFLEHHCLQRLNCSLSQRVPYFLPVKLSISLTLTEAD